MSSSSATRIQDKDNQLRVSVVPLLSDPTKNGVVICNADGSPIGEVKSVTHTEFRTLIDTSTLVPNQWYLITDYRTYDFIRQSNTPIYEWHTGDIEQIYVLALTTNEICPEGWSKDFPDEKIIYKPSRTIQSENPTWRLDSSKVNSGTVEVSTPSATIVSFDVNPYLVAPKDGDNFYMNISSGDFNYEYDINNKDVDWQFDVNGNFELLKTHYDIPIYRYIEYNGGVNTGSQEIAGINEVLFEATTPLTTFDDIDPNNYYYFYILDNDTGAENYYDYIDRDGTWKINDLGQFELLDSGSGTTNYAYYEEGVGNSGDIDVIIDSSIEFTLDRADWNLRKGSDQTGNTYFDISWSDSEVTSLGIYNYGTEWIINGNTIELIGNTHNLTTDLVSIEGGVMGTDQNTIIDLGDDVHIYSDLYSMGLDVDLTGAYDINGNYFYEIVGSDAGLIVGRQIPEIDLEIDVDYRATKFRRYGLTTTAYSAATTYNPGDIILYNSESYICLTTAVNRNPGSQPLYWIKMTSEEGDTIQNKYLGKDIVSLNTGNPYNAGKVIGATIVSGGTGYPVSTTVNLRVLGGDGQCIVVGNTDILGIVTSISSITTAGRGYVQNNSSYPNYCSSSGDGSGATVYVQIQDETTTVNITPNLESYTDFDIVNDIAAIRSNYGLKVKNNTTIPIDLVIKSDNNINSIITTNGGMATIKNVSNTTANLFNTSIVIKNFVNSNIGYMSNIISYTISSTKSKSLSSSSLYWIETSTIDAITYSFTGSTRITNTLGINWNNTTLQGGDKNTLNYLNNVLMVASSVTGNYINRADYFTLPLTYSVTQNNVTGYLKKVWCNSFFKSNVITSDCFYLSTVGSYCEGNVINGLVGVETTGGNSIFPCLFETFFGNNISGVFLGLTGKTLSFTNNLIKNNFSGLYMYRDEASTFQMGGNSFLGGFNGFHIYQNAGSFSNNTLYGSSSNIRYTYLVGASKQFTDNTVFGRLLNFTMTRGTVTNNTFYNAIGTGGANIVNSAISSSLVYCVFFGDVSNNTFSGSTTSSIFNYTCTGNVFSNTIQSCIFEQNFVNNTFTGTIYRTTFTKQVNSLVIPALSDVIFPTMVIRGKDDSASSQIFLIENQSAVDIFRVTGNDKIEVNGITGNSNFNFGKSISYPYLAATGNVTLGQNDNICEYTSGTFTVTLPSASGATRRVYVIKNSGTGIITVDAESTQTIDGSLTKKLNQYDSLYIQSNGTNWIILGKANGDNVIVGNVDGTVGANITTYATLGAELFTSFLRTNWTLTAGWDATNSNDTQLNKNAAGVTTATLNTVTPVAGKTYKCIVTIGATSGGGFSLSFGAANLGNTLAAGTYTKYVTAASTTSFVVTPSASAMTGTITALSIKEVIVSTGEITAEGNLRVGGSLMKPDGTILITFDNRGVPIFPSPGTAVFGAGLTIAGALSGATTIASSGANTNAQNSIMTDTNDAFYANETSGANTSTLMKIPGRLRWTGRAWDTAARTLDWFQNIRVNAQATVTSRMRWFGITVAGVTSEYMSLEDNSTLNVLGVTLGTENLTNGALTSGTSRSNAGDFALTGNTAVYTHSTGAGSITQAAASLAVPLVGNRWYKLTFTTSASIGNMTLQIPATVAKDVTQIWESTNGTYGIYFKTIAAPTDFIISGISTTTAAITIDTLSLKEVSGGTIMVDNAIHKVISSPGDLTITTGANKTLVLTNGVYDDIQFNISSGKVPAANAPTWSTWNTLSEYSFAVDDYIDLGAQELKHDWKEGSPVELHIHWSTGTGNYINGDRVNRQLEYTWTNMAASQPFTQFPAPTVVSAEQAFTTTVLPYSHVYTSITSFTPTGGKIGAQLKLRLKRIAKTTGTDPGTNPFALQVGLHYQIDTMGSRTQGGK